MVRAFLKRNGILIITIAVWGTAIAATALVIDKNVYQIEKKALLGQTRYLYEIFPGTFADLNEQVDFWRESLLRSEPPSEALKEEMVGRANAVIAGPTSIYRIEIKDASGQVLFDERIEKFRHFNDFTNSLWLRDFTMNRSTEFYVESPGARGSSAAPASAGAFRFHFTTPRPLPPEMEREMRALTTRYHTLTLAIGAVLTLLTALFIWKVLLPVRNVTYSLESSTGDRTHFIPGPSTHLEALYNGMARDAVMLRLAEHLGEAISGGRLRATWDVLTEACSYLADQQRAWLVACVELGGFKSPEPRWTGRRHVVRLAEAPKNPNDEQLAEAVARISESMATEAVTGEEPRVEKLEGIGRGGGHSALVLIKDPERAEVVFGLALAATRGRSGAEGLALKEFVRRLGSIVGQALGGLLTRERTMERERGRASINLSRNLGHDLTNIIARSKLELLTLETLLGNGGPPADGNRQAMVNESLRGLLDSTKFLQEVVNLYRAYSFLREPVFETQDANALINETIDLFSLSTSRKLRFERRLDRRAPACSVDPRLVKLALFNLFANSVEAIRQSGGGRREGVIAIATSRNDHGELTIEVQDNGTGILNEKGEPAGAEEIDRIFAMGYSSGDSEEGEGLGLSWVRTIVQEVHGGSIRVENAPGAGARFILTFPAHRAKEQAEEGSRSDES